MSKFNVGDKVKVIESTSYYNEGEILEVVYVYEALYGNVDVARNGVILSSTGKVGCGGGWRKGRFEFVPSKPKLDLTKPVQTRNGRPVEIFKTDGRGDYPILGYIGDTTAVTTFMADGTYYEFDKSGNNDTDLVNVPKKLVVKEGFLNLYADGEVGNTVHETLAKAAVIASGHSMRTGKARIGVTKVVLTEGDTGN